MDKKRVIVCSRLRIFSVNLAEGLVPVNHQVSSLFLGGRMMGGEGYLVSNLLRDDRPGRTTWKP